MSDISKIGANSPLSAYIKFTLDGFSTGEIPPKYVLDFSCEKIKDLTGRFSITLLYAPDTFKTGDDYLGLKLSALFNHLSSAKKSNEGSSEFTIPCTLEYGWRGTGIKVIYKQAVISGFSQDIDNGAFIKYNISGALNKSAARASQTKILAYDVNGDNNVNVLDLITAKKFKESPITPNLIDYLLNRETTETSYALAAESALSKIPAGSRLSDNIEALAKYIFEGIYDVIVDHTDEVMEEETKISDFLKNDEKQKSNDTLYSKLVNMVNNCYSISGYDVSFKGKIGGKEVVIASEFVESDQSIVESQIYTKYGFIGPKLTSINNIISDKRNITLNEIYTDTEIVKTAVKGEQYQMYFVDGDSNKHNKPTLRIAPKSAISNDAKWAHYTVSNNNRYNNVKNYSHETNLIPLISAFNNIIGNANVDIDVDTGEFIFTNIESLQGLTKETAKDYAQQYALELIKNLDNVTKANLEVVFDRYSSLLGIDDRINITNTVNNGNTLFNGSYWIKSAKDSLQGGILMTSYELIYTESDVEEYVKDKVLQLMYELKPSLNS